MKKLQILLIGVTFVLGSFALHTSQVTAESIDFLVPSDTTQNITQTGDYQITVRGADGGNSGASRGGRGATVTATFPLQAGDVLTIVTGLAGGNGDQGAGGGGSAVIRTRGGIQTLLIVAGAGGGAGSSARGIGGNSAQGTATGGGGAHGGGGFNADGGSGSETNGRAGTLSGGGAGGVDIIGGVNGGYGFGGGGAGGITPGGGGGYGGGVSGSVAGDFGGGGGTSFVDSSGISITRTNGADGGGNNLNGSVTVLAPTAASVTISGRVFTNTNRGLANATVYLSDPQGNNRIGRTNPFGYYRLEDIAVGQTVIITVVSKRHQFASQVLTVTEDIRDLDFSALAL